MYGALKLLSGSVHPTLARSIALNLGVKPVPITIKRFSDSEIYVKIMESIRGDDLFIIQPTCSPVNDSLMELLVMIDAARRASAGRINAVIPYYGYSRQDRKATAREAITSKLVANILTVSGIDRIITVDLHSDQIQGFFDIPLDHFPGYLIFYSHLKDRLKDNMVAVSPDTGAVKRTRRFASLLNLPLAIIDKRRPKHNDSEVMNIVGDVKGRSCILLDDIIDTAGTITKAASALMTAGAEEVMICATHAILSGDGAERLKDCPASEIILTDTIPISENKKFDKLQVISVAPLMARVIKRIHTNESIGKLFESDESMT